MKAMKAWWCAAAVMVGVAGQALGQTAPLAQVTVRAARDSGMVANTGTEPQIVWTTSVTAEGSPWIRLRFDEVLLAGDPYGMDGSVLRITSVLDGAEQTLRANHVEEWNHTSAYFNGDTVVVELLAFPGTGANRVRMSEFWAGVAASPDSICGPTDDRILSNDKRAGRLLPIGCSAWIFDDANHCFGTAGHCISPSTSNAVVEFNVPLSNSNGSLNHPPPSDQYAVDQSSIQSTGSGGTGNDAAYFGCFPNTQTGLTPAQAQGGWYQTMNAPAVNGDIRITGYGTVSPPVSPTWNQVQKTHVGPYFSLTGNRIQYQTDTTGGNSGSPVIHEQSGFVIGVHTHGGCSTTSGNSGTAFQHPGWVNFRNNPKGVCVPKCYADCDGNGKLELFDFLCYTNAFNNGDPMADCDGSGVLDLFDFLCFVNAFNAGCP